MRAKYGDDVRPTFHISPGTPAMGAIWIIEEELSCAVLSSGSQITEAEIRQSIFTTPTQHKDGILNRPLGNGFTLQQALTEVALLADCFEKAAVNEIDQLRVYSSTST